MLWKMLHNSAMLIILSV